MDICKDCVHYDICGNKKCNFMTEETTRKGLDFPCSDYKDISRFVDVVRCKDCMNYQTDIIIQNYGWCDRFEKHVYHDDFCRYGERKDGADNDQLRPHKGYERGGNGGGNIVEVSLWRGL